MGQALERWQQVLTESSQLAPERRPSASRSSDQPFGTFYEHEGQIEVFCHNIEDYGGTWLVVRPDGYPAPLTSYTAAVMTWLSS
jgi:hypothetical protein